MVKWSCVHRVFWWILDMHRSYEDVSFGFEVPFSRCRNFWDWQSQSPSSVLNSELSVQVGRMFDESRSGRTGLKGNGVRLCFSFKQDEFRRVSQQRVPAYILWSLSFFVDLQLQYVHDFKAFFPLRWGSTFQELLMWSRLKWLNMRMVCQNPRRHITLRFSLGQTARRPSLGFESVFVALHFFVKGYILDFCLFPTLSR